MLALSLTTLAALECFHEDKLLVSSLFTQLYSMFFFSLGLEDQVFDFLLVVSCYLKPYLNPNQKFNPIFISTHFSTLIDMASHHSGLQGGRLRSAVYSQTTG